MSHQNVGDDMSSNNIIIGATPSHWNNDGRGIYIYILISIYNSIITHEEFLVINCRRVKASDIELPRAQQISIHTPKWKFIEFRCQKIRTEGAQKRVRESEMLFSY